MQGSCFVTPSHILYEVQNPEGLAALAFPESAVLLAIVAIVMYALSMRAE